MISAGRVLLMPRGDFSALTTYELLDFVSYNGSTYVAKGDTTGNLPTDTTHWQLMAFGGTAANVASDFSANIEATQYASQSYAVGDFLVDKDSKLCRVTAAILQGSEIIIGTNVEVTNVTTLVRTVEESIAVVETKIATYSHDIGDHFYLSDVLYMATAAIQAGDTLTSGTNITPAADVCTQINELASNTATALNEVKNIIAPVEDTNTAVLSYSVGDQFIHNGALCKAKTAIDAGDTLVFNTNYEEAGQVVDQLSSVNEAFTNEVEARAALGAHNLLENLTTTQTNRGITQTVNADGSLTYSGSFTTGYTYASFTLNNKQKFKKGNYKLSGAVSPYANIKVTSGFDQDAQDSGNGANLSLASDSDTAIYCFVTITDAATLPLTIKPMIRLAEDSDPTYQSHAMTNKELTDVAVQTKGTIIFKKIFQSVSVTADGVKTCQTLLNELALAIKAQIQALGSDEYIRIVQGSFAIVGDCVSQQMYGYKNTDSALGVKFFQITGEANIHAVYMHTTLNMCAISARNLDSNTYINYTSQVPTSGSQLKLYYDVYKTIS